MSLPSDLTIKKDSSDTIGTAARIYSKVPNQAVYRFVALDGAEMKFTFTQAETKTRKRHLARVDLTQPPVLGVSKTMSVNMTIDQPDVVLDPAIVASQFDALYWTVKLQLTRLLNSEL